MLEYTNQYIRFSHLCKEGKTFDQHDQRLFPDKKLADAYFYAPSYRNNVRSALTAGADTGAESGGAGAADLEIMILTEVFDDMVRKAAQQIGTLQENARMRQELQERRFKELQMQINPHFMFNTLNMIAEKAYFEKDVRAWKKPNVKQLTPENAFCMINSAQSMAEGFCHLPCTGIGR